MANLKKDLELIGIKEYKKEELSILVDSLITQIPNSMGWGLPFELGSIKTNRRDGNALICSLGGTNWIVSLAEEKRGKIVLSKIFQKSFFIPSDKKFKSFESFIEEIELLIEKALLKIENKKINTIGIALAFPIISEEVEWGIDAKFKDTKLPKGWHIEYENGENSLYIGKTILDKLNRKPHHNIQKIVILNDVIAIGYGSNLGFIFGTGVNAACKIKGKLWNTEVGKSVIPKEIFEKDKVLKKQLLNIDNKRKLPIIEYLIGGEYIKDRFAIAMDLLIKDGYKIQNRLPEQLSLLETELLSDFANPFFNLEALASKYRIKYITPYEFKILKELSSVLLIQTSQLIGTIIASVIIKSNVKNSNELGFNVECSVFSDGYNVKELALEYAKNLLLEKGINTELSYTETSSTKGITMITLDYFL